MTVFIVLIHNEIDGVYDSEEKALRHKMNWRDQYPEWAIYIQEHNIQ